MRKILAESPDSHLRTNFRDSFFGEFTLFLGICNNWDHLLCTWQSLNDFSYFKIIFTMKHALSTLDDPIIASVSPTFTMALMVICVFLDRIFTNAAWINVLWIGAVILHFILMIYFVAVHIFPTKIELEHIYPSWFITFVGIGVIPNTSQLFINELGKIVLGSVVLLFTLVTNFNQENYEVERNA